MFAIAFLTGCAKDPPIPKYPLTDIDQSLAIARRNAPTQFTIEGDCTLTDERGQSIQLDVVLAVREPDRLRLRAWKFGQAVFDLTITPDGTWAYSGRPEFDREKLLGTVGVIRPWLKLFAPVPPGAAVVAESNREIELRSRTENADVKTLLDRPTLTVRSHTLIADGTPRATIAFERYVPFGDVVWPKVIRVRQGKRLIELETRTLQTTTTPKAFDPPKRAERVAE